MRSKSSIWVVCVAAACVWLAPARTIAQTEDQRTYFAFTQPVQLPGGKTLPPGKYIFRLADPTTSRKVVQVLSGDGKMVYGTFLTLPSRRVDASPDPEVRFMETPAGTPLAVLGCPFNSDGSAVGGDPPNGNGCANRQSVSHSSDDHEQVQTARVDYNIDSKNIAWFRFQSDTGLQAAYTDPINPLFNAFSRQPLYSFASGYTHVFSGRLVNYFNPAFSWYESLFGPADFGKTLATFPIVLQGSGANAPFTTLGGLDNTWVQGRRATRFFINDNLAWTVGSHELRFGTNSRIFRLNDYDFGEGAVPLVSYTTLP